MTKNRAIKSLNFLLFCLAGIFWIVWITYVAYALLDPSVLVSWKIFFIFLGSINFFLIPALATMFLKSDSLSLQRFAASWWLIIVVVFWIFAPFYSYLAINTNRNMVLWYMIPYAWEVPAFGFIFYLLVQARFKRARQLFIGYKNGSTKIDPNLIRKQFVSAPIFASWLVAILTFIAYGPVGSIQYRLFGQAPWPEVIKNIVTGTTMGFISALLFFFTLSELVKSYLEQLPRAKGGLPYSLSRKIGIITTALIVLAFLIYVPVIYRQAQELLARQKTAEIVTHLESCATFSVENHNELCKNPALGQNGYTFIVNQSGKILSEHPKNYKNINDERLEPEIELGIKQGTFQGVSHRRDTRFVAARPYRNNIIVALSFESEFLKAILPFLEQSMILAGLFGVVFIFIILLFIHGIINPVLVLTKLASSIKKQEFTAEVVKVPTGDEIEILADTFSDMNLAIREAHLDLKNKALDLAAKVTELERTKKIMLSVLDDLDAERKNLAEGKAKDDAILASIGDGLVVTDKDGKILMVNSTFEKLLGWKSKEIIGQYLIEAIPAMDEKKAVIPIKERILTQVLNEPALAQPVAYSFYYIRKDKTYFSVSAIIMPVILNGELIGVVEAFHDITREKEIDRAKSEFISIAAHQLRTPLSATKWTIDILMEDKRLSQKNKQILADLYTANERLIALVNDLMDITRLEEGRRRLEKKQVDVIKLVGDIIKSMTPQARNRGQRIIFKFDEASKDRFLDQELFVQAFSNILNNAISYGNERTEILIEIRRRDSYCLISVTDHGLVIPEAEKNSVFSKFYRSSEARKLKPDGSGLGLFIAKAAVEANGGKIWYESDTEKGTIFYFTVPIT